jgi:glycosyltransferase involved in cell wall biosynthesis
MKVSLYYRPRSGSWGGANQFLKALKGVLEQRGLYEERADIADAVVFNGYQELSALIRHFFFRRKTIRVYRLGPVMSLHRRGLKWLLVDYLMAFVASMYADVVVFQSAWSLQQAKRFGFWKRRNVHVIPNGVDNTIFFPSADRTPGDRIRLIYTSWSTNKNKGFSCLQLLDAQLNTDRYHMTFIGNAPIPFANIKTVPPVTSIVLADELRTHDIFISPTKDDACSNAILEALACGLPVVALDSGGNGELVQSGGLLFKTEDELLAAIDAVSADLPLYRSHINILSMEAIADRYLEAIRGSIKA